MTAVAHVAVPQITVLWKVNSCRPSVPLPVCRMSTRLPSAVSRVPYVASWRPECLSHCGLILLLEANALLSTKCSIRSGPWNCYRMEDHDQRVVTSEIRAFCASLPLTAPSGRTPAGALALSLLLPLSLTLLLTGSGSPHSV